MPHAVPLITTLAAAFALALCLGWGATRLRLPPLVGYLLTGILIGPFTPGFVADTQIASELAEIGVMLLMFGVGLHFSIDDLLDVRKIAVPGAVLQMVVATALGAALASTWGWDLGAAVVLGLCLSVASTVVLLRALESGGSVQSLNGRIAVGWLIVEDLAMVLVLVLLPPLAGWLGGASEPSANGNSSELGMALVLTLAKVSAFVVLMLVVGRKVFPAILWHVAQSGSRELFTLCVVAAAVGIAYGATTLFGVSFALGAFFAGMVLRESEFSHRAAEESLPLREAFAVLFFVSVGMLFDPRVLLDRPLQVLGVVAIIVVGKSLAAAILVLMLRYSLNTALTVSASLAQIGEFSFILAGLGVSLGLLPEEGRNLVLAGALISIALNPFIFAGLGPLQRWLSRHPRFQQQLERANDPLAELPISTDSRFLSGQVVLIGYGRVGRRIGQTLESNGVAFVAVDQNRELVERLRSSGLAVVCGNAVEDSVLIQAHIARASLIVISVTGIDLFSIQRILQCARLLNPDVEVAVCVANEDDADRLKEERLQVFLSEDQIANGMAGHILSRYGKTPSAG